MQIVIEIPEEDYIRLRDEGMFGNVTTFKRAVREGIPLAEQEPCKVGHWISNAWDDLKISDYTCSNCKCLSDEDSDYCPKCGSYNGGAE